MPSLTLTVENAAREPLPDHFDVEVKGLRTLSTIFRKKDVPGGAPLTISKLPSTEPLVVQVFPRRHRPVGAPTPILRGDEQMTFNAPIHPDFASPAFPEWSDVDAPLKSVLRDSTLEGDDTSVKGKKLFDSLDPLQRAGLLNLYTKMTNAGLPGGRTAWEFVTDLYRVRPDRVFGNVDVSFRDAMKAAAQAKLFKEAPDNQHTPPPGYERAGSFKSPDRAGNLQITFFSSASELDFKVDVDIDDANGLGHVFQVLAHWLTGGQTHPFDIHQILTFDQRLVLPYSLAT